MRTTLTLDPDVAALLERVREARAASLKQAVNEGLSPRPEADARAGPSARALSDGVIGQCLVGDLDNVAETLAVAEGDDCR